VWKKLGENWKSRVKATINEGQFWKKCVFQKTTILHRVRYNNDIGILLHSSWQFTLLSPPQTILTLDWIRFCNSLNDNLSSPLLAFSDRKKGKLPLIVMDPIFWLGAILVPCSLADLLFKKMTIHFYRAKMFLLRWIFKQFFTVFDPTLNFLMLPMTSQLTGLSNTQRAGFWFFVQIPFLRWMDKCKNWLIWRIC